MQEQPYIPSDEVTLKELIQIVKEYFYAVIPQWKKIILSAFVVGALLGVYIFFSPNAYIARLTFLVNEGEEKSGGALSSILGQFGVAGSTETNLKLVTALAKSKNIISKSIFTKDEINGKEDFLANHIIDLYKFHDVWEDSENGLTNFKFTHGNIDSFSIVENRAMNIISAKVTGNAELNIEGLFEPIISEETSIIAFIVNSESEKLSKYLVDAIYENLSIFYIEQSTNKQQKTYDIIKSKVDSLDQAMSGKQRSYLQFNDQNHNLLLQQNEAPKFRLQREVQLLTVAHAEAVKNLEIADFSLRNSRPYLQTIDRPFFPIDPVQKGLIKKIIIGLILGGFLATVYYFGRYFLQKELK